MEELRNGLPDSRKGLGAPLVARCSQRVGLSAVLHAVEEQ